MAVPPVTKTACALKILDRRTFLKGAGAVCAGVSIASGAKNDDGIRLGFSTYGMRDLPIIDALTTIADTGYRSVEIAAMDGWPSQPSRLSKEQRREIRRLLADRQLTLDALMLNIRPSTQADSIESTNRELLEAAELGADLADGRCPPIETVLGGRPDQWENSKDEIARGLEHWAELAEKNAFVIAIKPHVSGAMCTPQRAQWLRRRVNSDNIRLAYDYSHFGLQDIPLEESMRVMLPDAVFVHIKDYVRTGERFRFVLPGETDFDYSRYFELLRGFGYRGAACVEVSGQVFGKPDYDPIAAAKQCYASLTKAL